MRIIPVTAENVMRIEAVDITPDGSDVQITGRNAVDHGWLDADGTAMRLHGNLGQLDTKRPR